MASSNRHWPSLFKSKPCNSHLQWQHDINSSSLLSSACHKTPYSSGAACEERSPEPKPRWNPRPEQIRILEAIFNSGMVNPPRDEIRKIRAQLQEFGQVGDANVFYWFQNRKSRSKHKQRQLQQSTKPHSRPAARISVATSSSSSSSERSSSCSDKTLSSGAVGARTDTVDAVSDINPATVSQAFLGEFSGEPFFLQGHLPSGYCFSAADFSGLVGVPEAGNLGILSEMTMAHEGFKTGEGGEEEAEAKNKMQLHHESSTSTTPSTAIVAPDTAATTVSVTTTAAAAAIVACPVNEIQGIGAGGYGAAVARSTVVFINEVAFEVGAGAVNVREAFGEHAVLLHSSGHPVLVDDWGVTVHPLQHGASYYLV